MAQIGLQALLAPALIAASRFCSRRWGAQIGGVVSAFPAIAGPFLLLVACQHGERFAASAANGTLAGLVALSGFSLAYSRAARRHGWPVSLLGAWTLAIGLSLLGGALAPGPPLGLVLAVGSLVIARQLLCGDELEGDSGEGIGLLPAMALAAGSLGPTVGGGLAGLPVVATVLVVDTHRKHGDVALSRLLRGMLAGMAGFVVFCEAVSVLAVPAGIALTFTLAALAAAIAQAVVLYLTWRAAARMSSQSGRSPLIGQVRPGRSRACMAPTQRAGVRLARPDPRDRYSPAPARAPRSL
jgi:hypothetical protein